METLRLEDYPFTSKDVAKMFNVNVVTVNTWLRKGVFRHGSSSNKKGATKYVHKSVAHLSDKDIAIAKITLPYKNADFVREDLKPKPKKKGQESMGAPYRYTDKMDRKLHHIEHRLHRIETKLDLVINLLKRSGGQYGH